MRADSRKDTQRGPIQELDNRTRLEELLIHLAKHLPEFLNEQKLIIKHTLHEDEGRRSRNRIKTKWNAKSINYGDILDALREVPTIAKESWRGLKTKNQ